MILFIWIANFNTDPVSYIWTLISIFRAWNVLLLTSTSLQARGMLFYSTVVRFSLTKSHFYITFTVEYSVLTTIV